MPSTTPPPELATEDLARRLDDGEALQLLDIRGPDKVAQGHVTFGPALDFRALPGSTLYALPALDSLGLDPARPVAVICGHGNSSKRATTLLRERGFDAYTVTGGMAAWESVYLPRTLHPTPSLDTLIQLDRVAKGALSYILTSDGDAVVIDPGRHLDAYETTMRAAGVKPVAVIDTHMHADYLSGARTAADRWAVPYYLHPDDARSPYDGTAGALRFEPLADGEQIAFGRAALRAQHSPGHTLGSVSLIADDGLALTGDFLFVQSIGRPDLGGHAAAWTTLLWRSLEHARAHWPGDLLVLPAHYAGETERRADRAVAARFDVVCATNSAAAIQSEQEFRDWVERNTRPAPQSYRTIKLANLGLATLSDADAELVEFGPNQCAVPGAA